MSSLTGEWAGHITGTNTGRAVIKISDSGDALDGSIEVVDDEFGFTRYKFVGSSEGDQFRLKIAPQEWADGVATSPGTVIGRLQRDGSLVGIWETELGTAGKFVAKRNMRSSGMATVSFSQAGQVMTQKGPRRSSMTPLWVISVFVSLSEVVAGLAVTQAQGNVQVTLTIFVVTFPVLVAAAFFTILWKKAYVFYPPTEFGAGTNVSEYVRALGGLSATQAAERQRQLFGDRTEESAHPDSMPTKEQTHQDIAHTELAANVIKYFGFKRMRYSDVTEPTTRAVFNLGAQQGFNLFDGVQGIAFFGFFPNLEPVEIVARVRLLLNNIDVANRRVQNNKDSAQRHAALRILEQLYVEVLVPEDAPVEEIRSKIEPYRAETSAIKVSVYKPSEIERVVRREYESMGLHS